MVNFRVSLRVHSPRSSSLKNKERRGVASRDSRKRRLLFSAVDGSWKRHRSQDNQAVDSHMQRHLFVPQQCKNSFNILSKASFQVLPASIIPQQNGSSFCFSFQLHLPEKCVKSKDLFVTFLQSWFRTFVWLWLISLGCACFPAQRLQPQLHSLAA